MTKNSNYQIFKDCRFCASKNVEKVIDLGSIPLAGGFLKTKNSFKLEKKYPLELNFCKNCCLLQNSYSINPEILFKDYFYFSSSIKTLVNHFQENADKFSKLIPNNSFTVEIGSNDGSFLKAIEKRGSKILGVDPAENISEKASKNGIPMINDFFSYEVSKKITSTHGKADLIFSSNTLAHIRDMHTVFKGIEELLKDDGLLIFEVHYLPNLIEGLQYDMIYHEHEYYYSLLSLKKFLKKFNLKIYDAKVIPIHGGSIQVYATKNKKVKTDKSLLKLLSREKTLGIEKVKTYINFNKKINKSRKELITIVDKLTKKGYAIFGYGASGRGTIMSNYCDLNLNRMQFVIDDAPTKIGNFLPGTHQEIISSEILNKLKSPSFVILFAWSFADEIIKKNSYYLKSGGKFLIPLPKAKILK